MSKRENTKSHRELINRTTLLGVSGGVALVLFVFQCILFWGSKGFVTKGFSPWSLALAIPLFFGFFQVVLAVCLHRENPKVKLFINKLSQAKTNIMIAVLAILILMLYLLRLFVDPSSEIINLAMSSLGLLLFSQASIFCGYILFRKGKEPNYAKDRVLAVSLAIILTIWLILALTKFGLEPDTAFWNVAGVPGMWISLAGMVLFILLYQQITAWLKQKKPIHFSPKAKLILEILLILGIWLCASFIWIKSPYSNSYFITNPIPPDGHYWPKSDARLMDLGGQYLIIGGKLETPYFTEKPFYALFLGLLHYVFGQSYETITAIQIMFLALIPVFLYLLGKELLDRYLGFSLAVFAIIKEVISLYSTFKISVSNSRLMMTEMPSALLMLILAYILIKWLKQKDKGLALPLLAGLTLGIAIFVRSSFLVVFPAVLFFLLVIGIKTYKRSLLQLSLVLLGVLIVITPWIIYNQVKYGKDPLSWKVQAALSTRFTKTQTGDRKESPKEIKTPEPVPTSIAPQAEEIIPKPQGAGNNANTATQEFYPNKFSKVAAHFLNNHVKSLFVLPIQIYPAHLTTLLDQAYWDEDTLWQGKLPPEAIAAFIFNLFIIVFGITYAWRKFNWAGLVPLMLLEAYALSNALVRTSGGRYLVPFDWVVYAYFFLGLFAILQRAGILAAVKQPEKSIVNPSRKAFWLVLCFSVIVGLSLPVLNLGFPTRYTEESNQQVFERLPLQKIEQEIGIPPGDIQSFIQSPNNLLMYGRGIYPAYHAPDEKPDEKAITYTVLTPKLREIAMPFGRILSERLPVGEDMILIGCKSPTTSTIRVYFIYFVQSDKLIWSDTTTFKDICMATN